MGSISDTVFASVNESSPNPDGLASSASRPISIADIGMHDGKDDVFVAVGISSTVESVAGTADSKGREDSGGSDMLSRSESSVTQTVGVGGGTGRGQREHGRMLTTASSVTEADNPAEAEGEGACVGGSPQSPTGPHTTTTVRESSTPGTDVE